MRKLSTEEIRANRFTPEELQSAERMPVVVLIDNVRSLYNVGSIFRTSDAARVQKLYLTGFTPHPPRKEIEKTALGATKTVPWEYFKEPSDALAAIRADGFRICLLEQTTASIPHTALTPEHLPLCIVVGNEITGISGEIAGQADMAIEIPMHGLKHSLNVAVAYGIAIYQCVNVTSRIPRDSK